MKSLSKHNLISRWILSMAQDVYRAAFGLYQIIPPMNYHAYSCLRSGFPHVFHYRSYLPTGILTPSPPICRHTVIGHREATFILFFKSTNTESCRPVVNQADQETSKQTKKKKGLNITGEWWSAPQSCAILRLSLKKHNRVHYDNRHIQNFSSQASMLLDHNYQWTRVYMKA